MLHYTTTLYEHVPPLHYTLLYYTTLHLPGNTGFYGTSTNGYSQFCSPNSCAASVASCSYVTTPASSSSTTTNTTPTSPSPSPPPPGTPSTSPSPSPPPAATATADSPCFAADTATSCRAIDSTVSPAQAYHECYEAEGEAAELVIRSHE